MSEKTTRARHGESGAVDSVRASSLRAYQAKRDFAVTPEPREGGESGAAERMFVVQKHWASSLHYDFRLELDGTLKSWAVPKGPSLDPAVKRMAVQVEDHPIAYAGFEGTVPAKQYGAGKVIVWDSGTWSPLGEAQQGYRDGNLKFALLGHKLRGKWALIRMKGKGEKQTPWLLIKEKDAFARPAAEFSVVDELPDSVKARATPAAARPPSGPVLPPEAVAARLPEKLSPQLASLATGDSPDPADWLYEIKFDGYRILTRIDAAGVRLFTRNGHDWTAKLQSLHAELERISLPSGWYDGEIVVPGDNGIPDFGALQRAFEAGHTNDVVLYLFDLPYFDGHDLRGATLEARRAVLQRAMSASRCERLRFSEAFDASGASVMASACRLGLEGIVAKRRSAPYRSSRSADWIKLKCGQRQEFVVGGYTDPGGARAGFGALLLGVHDARGTLHYAGSVGSGFNGQALKEIGKALGARARSSSPFAAGTAVAGRPHWVEPTLVAEVSFGEWTRAGRIRHGVFRGLRADKRADTIVREVPVRSIATKASTSSVRHPSSASAGRLQVTNPQRVIDASTGTTKVDLVRYYGLVGDLMMSHLKRRPVSLLRAPTGIDGPLFFQKHAEIEKLPGIRLLDPALDPGHAPMMEVAGKAGLRSAAQWNAVEFHTLNTGTASFEHPDRMVFDLDPGAGVPWGQVQEAAQLAHAFLAQLGLASFLKTSGGKGLHVVVPVRRLHDWDTVKGFSRAIVQHMARTIPQRFVAKSGPKNRVGKIFIDYLRNGLGASTVCAWSARARPGLGISVPVAWSELPTLRGGDHWTVKSAHGRLDVGNAPWAGYSKAARGLTAAMSALGYTPRTDV
ncbi:MAG: DNA ligase D [Burkholderiaceae bacterium]